LLIDGIVKSELSNKRVREYEVRAFNLWLGLNRYLGDVNLQGEELKSP